MAKPGGVSARTQLVNLVAKLGAHLFHAPDGSAFATVPVGNHRETLYLGSPVFTEWLAREYYRATKKVPGSADLKDAIRVLMASARHVGPERPVSVRLARIGNVIYLDLGSDDFRVVRVTADGWVVAPASDVKLWRPRGLLPLPIPVRSDESLAVMLKRLINIVDPTLIIAWLLGALRGRKPYPLLAINGEHGSAKSTAQAIVRRLIDPNTAPLRLPPKDPRDLMIYALNSHVLAFDNLSVIQDWLSDALCVLATGGGFSTRELYSDREEALFSAERPTTLNGISNVVTRPDLLDRSLVVSLEPIPDDHRKSEAALEAMFISAHPAILAALLDAVSMALANEATTVLDRLPRMADFATWIAAAAPALGMTTEDMLTAYQTNRDEAVDSVLDGDVVVDAIRALPLPWTGQLKDLHLLIPESEHRPRSPRGLRGALVRRAPALRHVGITLTFTKGHTHTVTIARSGALVTAAAGWELADAVPF